MQGQRGASSGFGQLVALWRCKICVALLVEVMASANMAQSLQLFQICALVCVRKSKFLWARDKSGQWRRWDSCKAMSFLQQTSCFCLCSGDLSVFQRSWFAILLHQQEVSAVIHLYQWTFSLSSGLKCKLSHNLLVHLKICYSERTFLLILKENFLLWCIELLVTVST